MSWTNEKIQNKKAYFKNERIEKRGKFTEFVVRAYYCIYKACANNDGKCCFANDVSARKIKGIIYEGFYDGVPDHDNKAVIDDCVYHLKSMNYIKFKKENEKWVIYLNQPLDFLLVHEHESYLNKFEITKEVKYLLYK